MKAISNTPTLTTIQESCAPWNSSPHKGEFYVTISQTLSKDTDVSTYDYFEEVDEDGFPVCNTQDVDWKAAYRSEHMNISELLRILKEYIEKDLAYGDSQYTEEYLEYLLKECQGWITDELEVIEN